LNTGSYGFNGWLYYNDGGTITTYCPDVSKLFNKESAITRASETPTFYDSVWPDGWPQITDLQTVSSLDLGQGPSSGAKGIELMCLSRHPLKSAMALANQRIVGGITMGFADGHAASWKLQDVKNVVWSMGFTPNANPWATSL
jgi:prepilin-type processing-associated H-X9-DG protein